MPGIVFLVTVGDGLAVRGSRLESCREHLHLAKLIVRTDQYHLSLLRDRQKTRTLLYNDEEEVYVDELSRMARGEGREGI